MSYMKNALHELADRGLVMVDMELVERLVLAGHDVPVQFVAVTGHAGPVPTATLHAEDAEVLADEADDDDLRAAVEIMRCFCA